MGRRKKEDKQREEKNGEFTIGLRNETLGWVIAIGLFAIGIFFLLSSLGKGGIAGTKVFDISTKLFGLGFYLLPLLSFMLSVAWARSSIKPVSKAQSIGATFFFLGALSLTNISMPGRGGIIGKFISDPLIKLFDTYAAVVMLTAIIIASSLVILDSVINFGAIFGIFRKKEEEDGKETELSDKEMGMMPQVNPLDAKNEIKMTPMRPVREGGEFGDLKLNSKSYSSDKPFIPPPLSLLEKDSGKANVGDVKANANIIKRTLQNFGIIVEMDEVSIGPSVTRYALKPAEGVKLAKILGLQSNLELALAAHPVRIEAPIPGKSLVGIELPNAVKATVGLATLLAAGDYQESEKPLMMALGKGISGNPVFGNMAKMPHMLIAGATGSGKSVTIHALIQSLLFRNPPDNLKFIMIDPKRVELTLYNKIPHLLTPVLTEAKKAIMALKWAAKEMDRRYNVLEQSKVRDIESYHKNILANSKGPERAEGMPYIMIIIDELADIMQAYPRELESAIVRLAQMSRAVGIHLILSTQRPSVNVITGLIKANIPARIALQVASQIDSRTILDMAGAEKLLGAGDMLYMSGEMSKPIRLQSAFISETEVKRVVEYLKEAYEDEIPEEINLDAGKDPNAIFESIMDEGGDDEDDLYSEAKETVVRSGKASTSFLQRKLRVGYARAARLMDMLEDHGVIGPGDGAKTRDVLVRPESGFEPAVDDFEDDVPNDRDSDQTI